MQIKSTLKQLIKNNPLYKDFIRPMRIKLKEKALAKLDDESYFIKRHKKIFGYTPDFKNPQTFNEKIIHRILFDRNPIYTALADKLKARIYIATILKDFNANNTLDSNKDANTLVSHTNHITHITTGGGGKYSLNQNDTESSNMISQEAQNKENKNSESKYTSNSQSTQNIDFTQHTPQSPTPTPNQAINNPDALLTKDSLLFQPIDTLTQELFNTNFCPYLPKLYGIYKSVDEIDFSKLPQSFVLKTNHASGGVVPVPNKETFLSDSMGFEKAMDKLTKNLNINYYTLYREWHYKDIEPRIFAEEMLDCGKNSDDKKWEAPLDYKIHIMHDKIGYIEVAADSVRHHKELIVDTQYNEMPFDLGNRMDFLPEKPKDFDIMLDMARKLAYFTDYVRVDLYYVNNKIYVGELTFTNAGGADTFNPQEWDRKLGELWQPNLCKQYEACANNLLSCSKSL